MTTIHNSTDFTAYLLAEMRCAVMRSRIQQLDLEAVGIALRDGLISADQAIRLLDDVDVLRLIGTEKFST